MSEIDEVSATIHHSLTRPQLMMGCDREMYFMLILVVVLLVVPGGIMEMDWRNVIYGLVIWFVGQQGLAYMAKRDAYMRQVFVRSMVYSNFYPANEYIWEHQPDYKRW